MKINNNIQALNAYRNLNMNQFQTSKNLEKLSSGLRINRAADDAAGLAISEKMRGQIRGLQQAERNALDGVSLVQTAEGAIGEMHSILQRMRELTVQSANDTNTKSDREQIQKEVNQLTDEIDSITDKTQFNTQKLLKGGDIEMQIGANQGESVTLTLSDLSAKELGIREDNTDTGHLDVSTDHNAADSALTVIDTAIEKISSQRSDLGAVQNRLEHTIANLSNARENLTAAESRIRDADMALEMTEFTRNNILNQAGTAMLAQANQLPQGVLQLLQ